MYNSFIFERAERVKKARQVELSHESSDKKKYSGVRDHLVQRYNKRVENFMYRMQENPIEVEAYRNPLDVTPTKYRHTLSKNDFKFQKSDWEVLQRSFGTTQGNDRSIASQSVYPRCLKEDIFRQRAKDREIQQQPMRFNYTPNLLKRLRAKGDSLRKTDDEEDSEKRLTTNNESFSYDDDAFSVGSRVSKKNTFPGIATIRTKTMSRDGEGKYREKVSGEQNKGASKIYFKAIAELCQRERRLSKTAKEILHKCKIINFKYTKDESERDMFEAYHRDE